MKSRDICRSIVSAAAVAALMPVAALAASYHHVHITAPSPIEAVK